MKSRAALAPIIREREELQIRRDQEILAQKKMRAKQKQAERAEKQRRDLEEAEAKKLAEQRRVEEEQKKMQQESRILKAVVDGLEHDEILLVQKYFAAIEAVTHSKLTSVGSGSSMKLYVEGKKIAVGAKYHQKVWGRG